MSCWRFLSLSHCLFLALACAPRPDSPLEGYNLVLINIDTLRADRLGCYGHDRDTSPFIDRLAAEGVLYENAYANSSFTRQSVASLFTGRLPTCVQSIGWSSPPAPGVPTIGQRFRQAGYRTGFFSNTVMLKNPQFTRGFEEVRHLPQKWNTSRAGPLLSERALAFVREEPDRPFMVYVHYLDPHAPYDPPPAHRSRFADGVHPNPVSLVPEVRQGIARLLREGFGPGESRFEDLRLRYDAEISHTDHAIEALFAGLAELSVLDRTAVVITSDHGEEFLEHGFVDHAWTLYEESLRVPLILWAPEALEPQRISEPVSSVDVLPTLLDLMGLARESDVMDGSPVLGAAPPDRAIISELMIRERTMVRAVNKGEWKYIATYQWLAPRQRGKAAAIERDLRKRGYDTPLDPWPRIRREELYRISTDPGERDDVSRKFPQKLEELRATLDAHRRACAGEGVGGPPDAEGSPSPEEEERLRALGYL